MATIQKYAKTVINQHDLKYTRNDWEHPENAQNYVTNTAAKGAYTKVKSKYIKPHTLYAYDFEMGEDLPKGAFVKSIKFEVRMRHSGKLDVKAPIGVFNYWNTVSRTQNVDSAYKTGWYYGAYRYAPSKKIGTAYSTFSYTISSANLAKYNNINSILNSHGFGLQLRFQDAKTTGTIYVEWIRMTVEYESPSRYFTFQDISREEDAPTSVSIGKETTIKIITGNSSRATEDDRTYIVDLPIGFEIIRINLGGICDYTLDGNTITWTVTGEPKSECYLDIKAIPHASGLKELRVYPDTYVGHYDAYLYVQSDRDVGYDEIYLTPGNLRRGETSCVSVNLRGQFVSSDYTITFDLPDDVTESDVVSCELNTNVSSPELQYNGYTIEDNLVVMDFDVNADSFPLECYLEATLCFIPRSDGRQLLAVVTTNHNKTIWVDIAEPYQKHIIFNKEVDGSCSETIKLTNNRFVTQVEGDVVVLPISTDEYDKDMYVDDSTLELNQWKKVRYIGCVELPYSHYDPKHSSKDKLLDEHFKNNEFIGKECAVDEIITLKVKVPRRKTPTLIGLVNIDRPIPINLVPEAFENDPLNHRGWAEFYGIEVEPTNPLYDTCELDVKYITHNIISRFNIYHGGAINQFQLPNVLNTNLTTGDEIGNFFDITTDGSYIYDDEEEILTHRNLFSISNGQTILLRSKEQLASRSQFEIYWDTALFNEFRENNIHRFVRLVDEKGNVAFEYEYCNFDFSGDVYTCDIMGRVLTDNGMNLVINRKVYIHSDVEHTEDIDDEDYDDEDIDIYGSNTVFDLDSTKLTVTEKGFSGYEFQQEVTLLTGNYHLEVYWQNKNNDADSGNSISYFDFEIGELAYDSQLAAYYNKLLVSPYPVPRKKILFTRECEEGTIYYLENDGGDYEFLLEPFYQYKCGTDLVAEGASIFDFNNSYPVIYIQNGLIRFGINRLNGDLYLDKWDNISKSYIRTNRFRIDKFNDAEVTTINDDIIVVKISEINITMWRGRPYVMLQHPKEDINILNNASQVFCDGINDDPLEYPVIFNLINSKNILPECIGGTRLIKSSCVTVKEEDVPLSQIGALELSLDKTSYLDTEEITCSLSESIPDVALIVNGVVAGTFTNGSITIDPVAAGLAEFYAIYMGNATTAVKVSNKVSVEVIENIPVPEEIDPETDDIWNIECLTNTKNKLKYNQGTVDYKLTHNGIPVSGLEMEVYNTYQTWHLTTPSTGIVESKNEKVLAGKRKWIATVYDDGVLLAKNVKTFTVVESTPKITGVTLSLKKGKSCKFKIEDESGNPLSGVNLDVNIGGKKYVRKTNSNGEISVKMGKTGTYSAKIKFAAVKNKYKTVSKKFTVVVK